MKYTVNNIKVGDSQSISRTVTEADIVIFGGVSGDLNPAHFDEEYAKDTFFKGRIAHGMISASYLSAVLGTKLPGPGTIYLSQTLKFLAPVRIGDTITAICEVKEINKEKGSAVIKTYCKNQRDEEVLTGEAKVILPK